MATSRSRAIPPFTPSASSPRLAARAPTSVSLAAASAKHLARRLRGQKILNIVPSLDTGLGADSERRFEEWRKLVRHRPVIRRSPCKHV
jgi:peroxiredoxin